MKQAMSFLGWAVAGVMTAVVVFLFFAMAADTLRHMVTVPPLF